MWYKSYSKNFANDNDQKQCLEKKIIYYTVKKSHIFYESFYFRSVFMNFLEKSSFAIKIPLKQHTLH